RRCPQLQGEREEGTRAMRTPCGWFPEVASPPGDPVRSAASAAVSSPGLLPLRRCLLLRTRPRGAFELGGDVLRRQELVPGRALVTGVALRGTRRDLDPLRLHGSPGDALQDVVDDVDAGALLVLALDGHP